MKNTLSQDRTTRDRMVIARELRLSPTPAEAALWEQIRDRRLGGLKFRRQHPWHGYVLDAFCPALRLAIEIDGKIHGNQEQARLDADRQTLLESEGIHLLRFRNEEIEQDMARVLKRILQEAACLTPAPPLRLRQRGVTRAPFPSPNEVGEGEGMGMG
ncbi:MAG: endonuclease domain-containing protein [Chloroflexota bacterium]|nr:endonuclease domain-containing protein [Chloroflexota bacterium]